MKPASLNSFLVPKGFEIEFWLSFLEPHDPPSVEQKLKIDLPAILDPG